MSGIVLQNSDGCTGDHELLAASPFIDGDVYEWVLADQPFGAGGALSTTAGPTTILSAPVAGCYDVELRITRFNGSEPVVETPPDLLLGCPQAVVAGDTISVYYECSGGGTISNVTLAGPNNGFTVGSSIISIATNTIANGGTIGNLTVTVECIDSLGNTIEEECEIFVHAETVQFIPQTSETICVAAVECQTTCLTFKRTLCFADCGPLCDEGFVSIDTKDKPQIVLIPDKTPPTPLTQQFLSGSKQILAPDLGESLFADCGDGCYEQDFYCYTHRPAFCWNNACACPGWMISGPGLFGTSAADACCFSGRPWIFEEQGTFVASGPNTPQVSCAVIWGHNIASGTITTTPAIDPNGSSSTIDLCFDEACMNGFTRPIVLNLIAQDTNTVSMTIQGTTVDGGPIRIAYIFMGDKLFLEDDLLPDGFVNPHNGSDFFVRTKENECGYPISREVERVRKSLSLNLSCLSEAWLKTKWRSYLRYLSSAQPVLFQWSRNGCPNDIFMGDLTSAQQGSTYDSIYQSIDFTIEGYCSQPQAKRLS